MFLWILFLVLAVRGAALLIVSNFMHFKRTQDRQLSRFRLERNF
jgi:hypothetical protein